MRSFSEGQTMRAPHYGGLLTISKPTPSSGGGKNLGTAAKPGGSKKNITCGVGNQPQMITNPIQEPKSNPLVFSLLRVTGMKTPGDPNQFPTTL